MSKRKSHSAILCEAIANGEINPFWTIESIGEHCNVLWGWYKRAGYDGGDIVDGKRVVIGKVGDFDFELNVIERYAQELFNEMVALLPDLYLASDGDTAALERIKPAVEELALAHQVDIDKYYEWNSKDES